MGAAHRDFRRLRVFHPQNVIPAEPRDDLLDLVDVHQMRPMHPPEHGRVEALVQLVEGAVVGRARVLAGYYRNAFVGERGVNYFFGLHEQEALADLDREPLAPALPFRHCLDDLLQIGAIDIGRRLAGRSEATRRLARSTATSSRA